MAVKFYLEVNGSQIVLPVSPSELSVSRSGMNQTEEIVSLGEINLLRNVKLEKLALESFFPKDNYYPFLAVDKSLLQPPLYYVNFIRAIQDAKRYCKLTISNDIYNRFVSVESFDINWRAGHDGDIFYKLELLEYRKYSAYELKIVDDETNIIQTTPLSGAMPEDIPAAASHTVAPGDTLWAIAKKHLGDGGRYTELAEINEIKNPNLIYPGQVIRLPE